MMTLQKEMKMQERENLDLKFKNSTFNQSIEALEAEIAKKTNQLTNKEQTLIEISSLLKAE